MSLKVLLKFSVEKRKQKVYKKLNFLLRNKHIYCQILKTLSFQTRSLQSIFLVVKMREDLQREKPFQTGWDTILATGKNCRKRYANAQEGIQHTIEITTRWFPIPGCRTSGRTGTSPLSSRKRWNWAATRRIPSSRA